MVKQKERERLEKVKESIWGCGYKGSRGGDYCVDCHGWRGSVPDYFWEKDEGSPLTVTCKSCDVISCGVRKVIGETKEYRWGQPEQLIRIYVDESNGYSFYHKIISDEHGEPKVVAGEIEFSEDGILFVNESNIPVGLNLRIFSEGMNDLPEISAGELFEMHRAGKRRSVVPLESGDPVPAVLRDRMVF